MGRDLGGRDAAPVVAGGGTTGHRDGPTGELVLPGAELPDLAPAIHRQRLVVEGLVEHDITADQITTYLRELSVVTRMRVLADPVTHRSERYGWAGWIHWETSGAHFYAWEHPVRFFSVDVYACRPFDPAAVVDHAALFFRATRTVAKTY